MIAPQSRTLWVRPENDKATVATVLDPSTRSKVDLGGHGYFETLHARSLPEIVRAVRERPVSAVLVSPRAIRRDQIPAVGSVTRRLPGVPVVAVTSGHDTVSSERLLQLGACGVRQVIDLNSRDGWKELRGLVSQPNRSTAALILGAVIPALGDPTDESRYFFEFLVRAAPGVPTVRALAGRLQVRPSTFMSRFFRAGLPSPKRYLTATRLLYAAALLEEPRRCIADVAIQLEYSTPQCFNRHVGAVMGVTAGEFRRRYALAALLDDYTRRLVTPFQRTFESFYPLGRS